MIQTALSLVVLSVFALAAGAVYLWRRGDAASRKKAGLMLVLAVVMAVNVGIWTLPTAGGGAPLAQQGGR